MKAIDVIRSAMQLADQATMKLIEDMRDAALTQPTSRGGNHPLWVLGHITLTEGNIPHVIFGEPNPVAHWAPLFAPGTEPRADAGAYPPFEEILRTYRDLRARNLQTLEELGDEGLDRKSTAPPKGLEHVLGTVGSAYLTIAMHQMNHRGQVADCRRVAGREPVFTPTFDY
ncbi:MAG TPA: DinB family protein [Tepidisphaeraceae bacterium]